MAFATHGPAPLGEHLLAGGPVIGGGHEGVDGGDPAPTKRWPDCGGVVTVIVMPTATS